MKSLEQRVLDLELKARRWRIIAMGLLAIVGVRFFLGANPPPQDVVASSLAVVNSNGKPLLTVSNGQGGMILSLRSAEGRGEIRMEPLPDGGYFQISRDGFDLASITTDSHGAHITLSDGQKEDFHAPDKK